MLNQIVLLCRAGFEKECAGEIMAIAKQLQCPAYIQTRDHDAVVRLIGTGDMPLTFIMQDVDFRELIFTRQWFLGQQNVTSLDENNRLSAILDTCNEVNKQVVHPGFYDIELDYADTNEGKSLSKFCRQFKPHLLQSLKKNRLLNAHSQWRLHLYFADSLHVTIGISPIENSAIEPMGIPRLRMPSTAPSRSTLKLDEAILWFISTDTSKQYFKNGMTAVDLGAAPGGWSWQLVQRGCLVTAVDNGPMQKQLIQSGMVEHLTVDAFTYEPAHQVDWMVCDMVERPMHVSRLVSRWFTRRLCRNAIFNLKLPMKKRLDSANECLHYIHMQLSQAGIKHSIQAKHLYHDREEITVCVLST